MALKVKAVEKKIKFDKDPSSFLALIDDIDAEGCQAGGEDVFGIERFAKTEAGGEGTNNGNERIPDGHLANGIAGEQFVVERETDGGDGNEQGEDAESPQRDMRKGGPHEQTGNDEQCTTHSETVARTHKDVDALVDTTRQETGKGATQGIQNYQSVAQKSKRATILSPNVQRQDACKTNDTTQELAVSHLVALEEHTSQNDQREDTHGVEDSRPRALTIGQSDIEECVVQRGVHQGKEQQEKGVASPMILKSKRTTCQQGDNKDDDTRKAKAKTCEEHLAGCHILRDAKLCKAQFDEWERPSPAESSQECQQRHPCRSLEDAGRRRVSHEWQRVLRRLPSQIRIVLQLVGNGGLRPMTRIDNGILWQGAGNLRQTLLHLLPAALREVRTTNAHAKQRVTREHHAFLLAIEQARAVTVARCRDYLQLVLAKRDGVAIAEQSSHRRLVFADFHSKEVCCLLG